MNLLSMLGSGRRQHVGAIGNPSNRQIQGRQDGNTLLASGERLTAQNAEALRALVQAWQARSFSYYDKLGEIKYAAQFYSRMLSPLRLYVGKKNKDGDFVEIDPAAEPVAYKLLDRVQDPGGGRSGLLSAYGRLMFLAGEGYLYVTKRETSEEQWEMLSTDELRPQGDSYLRYRAPSLQVETAKNAAPDSWEVVEDGTAIAYRIWKRHPRFSWLADSTMMGALDIAEELLLLTYAVRARAKSRLAGNGLLLVPEGIGPPPLDASTGAEDLLEDPFFAALIDHIVNPIQDEGSASAAAPMLVRGKADLLEKIRHLSITDPMQLYPETGLRRECIDRLAIGLDMPPEVLTGTGDANHWSGWQIDEQSWKAHGKPVAQQFCDDFTGAYFRPGLKASNVENPQDFAIMYDPADVINHPDRGKDAKDVHDRGALSDETLRESTGFTEDDAPSEEEKNVWLGVRIRDSGLAKTGIPTLNRGAELELKPGEILAPTPGGGVESAKTPGGGGASAEAQKGPPPAGAPAEPPQATPPVKASANGEAMEAHRLLGACELAVYRARELAGHRLKSLANRNPEIRKLTEEVRPHKVAWKLGPETVAELGTTPQLLVHGAGDLVADSLHLFGLRDSAAADVLADRIEQHAARTLFEERPSPLPPSLQNYVTGLQRD